MRRALSPLPALVLSVVVACRTPTDPPSSALTATLSAESSVIRVGDSTIMTLVVRNESPIPGTRSVPAGNLAFDVAIERVTGGEVWRRSSQLTGTPAVTRTIPPLSSVSFQLTLRVGGPTGANLSPGEYRLRGFYVGTPFGVIAAASPVLSLTVRASP